MIDNNDKLEEAGGLHEGVAVVAEAIYEDLLRNLYYSLAKIRMELIELAKKFDSNGQKPQESKIIDIPLSLDRDFLWDNIQTDQLSLQFDLSIDVDSNPMFKKSPIRAIGGSQSKSHNGGSVIRLNFTFCDELLYLDNKEFEKAIRRVLGAKTISVLVHELKHDYESTNTRASHDGKQVIRKSYHTLNTLDDFANQIGDEPVAQIFRMIQDTMYKTSEIEERAVMAELAYAIRRTGDMTKEKLFEVVRNSRMNEIITILGHSQSAGISNFIKRQYNQAIEADLMGNIFSGDPKAKEYMHARLSKDMNKIEGVVNAQAGEFLNDFIINMMTNIDEAFNDNFDTFKGLGDKEYAAYKKAFMLKTSDRISGALANHVSKRISVMKKKMYKVAAINYYIAIKNDANKDNIEGQNLKAGSAAYKKANTQNQQV